MTGVTKHQSEQRAHTRTRPLHVRCSVHMSIVVAQGGMPVKAIPAHKPGDKVIQPDGHPAYGGLRGMRMVKNNTVLLTGAWDVSARAAALLRHWQAAAHPWGAMRVA